MRISAVQNYYRPYNTYYTNKKANPPQTKANYISTSMVSSSPLGMKIPPQVNFTGIQYTPLALAKRFPLEDRLADLFNVSMSGDTIIAGKDLKTAQKLLKDNIHNFKHAIKRILFVPEDNLDGIAVFSRTPKDNIEVFNPNKDNMFLTDASGKRGFLRNGENGYVIPGDSVKIGNRTIHIKSKPKADISVSRSIFAKTIDCSKELASALEKANLKAVSTLVTPARPIPKAITFADIGGQDGVIKELKKGIIYPVKYPEAYKNATLNHGFILYGPPGTGKTLIAQALANEAKASFIKLNGLEMESKWIGESEENWRNLFAKARENQPSVIFIDEFDAVAKKRGSIDVFGDKVVNQILTLMSDVEKNGDDIFVVAATNNQKALDSAITRSGRFGKHIEVKAPDTTDAVAQIFGIHTKNQKLAQDLDKKTIYKQLLSKKATGADIARIVNDAHENAFERAGIYQKMENDTLKSQDIEDLRITNEDFFKAIKDFDGKTSERKPVGFNK